MQHRPRRSALYMPASNAKAIEKHWNETKFSDGERFFKANTDAAWTHYDEGPPGCAQPTPQGPVTAFAVTEATTFVSFAGYPGAPGLWRSPEDRS